MKAPLPVTFNHNGLEWHGVITPENADRTVFSLYVNEVWVAVIVKKNEWSMDGKFAGLSNYFGKHIENNL